MYKAKKVLGTMVVDLESARNFGRVRNMVLDFDQRKIIALILPGKSWLHAPVWLDFDCVQGLGRDAVSVMKSSETISTREIKDIRGHLSKCVRNLWGITVVSQKGKLVGYVEDLLLSIPGGAIEGIELSHGVLGDILEGRGFLPAEQIVSMSLECVVVEGQQVM
jgi:uncharacterized protein YrrD